MNDSLLTQYQACCQDTEPEYHVFSPYCLCPLGAHVDHQHGLITGFALDQGIDILCYILRRLLERDLELKLSMPEEPLYILADGRQLWRIFDNLLNNACKYAMQGTRVYLDAAADAQAVTVTMKNISAAPLNVSPDELMERFVRGDASRHTEGSGLGLSIARELLKRMDEEIWVTSEKGVGTEFSFTIHRPTKSDNEQ